MAYWFVPPQGDTKNNSYYPVDIVKKAYEDHGYETCFEGNVLWVRIESSDLSDFLGAEEKLKWMTISSSTQSKKSERCSRCDGSGMRKPKQGPFAGETWVCFECHGSGKIYRG